MLVATDTCSLSPDVAAGELAPEPTGFGASGDAAGASPLSLGSTSGKNFF
jgi:hypothetical protein